MSLYLKLGLHHLSTSAMVPPILHWSVLMRDMSEAQKAKAAMPAPLILRARLARMPAGMGSAVFSSAGRRTFILRRRMGGKRWARSRSQSESSRPCTSTPLLIVRHVDVRYPSLFLTFPLRNASSIQCVFDIANVRRVRFAAIQFCQKHVRIEREEAVRYADAGCVAPCVVSSVVFSLEYSLQG